MHVLIIDDELALRQIISATVRRAGYSVDMASGVKDAAAKLVRGDFDVAICDIRMQDGDGVELVRSMKSSGVATLFIMVTAFASVQTAVEALRAGAMDYMVKPVDSEELLYRLRQAQTLLGLKAENVALRIRTRLSVSAVTTHTLTRFTSDSPPTASSASMKAWNNSWPISRRSVYCPSIPIFLYLLS